MPTVAFYLTVMICSAHECHYVPAPCFAACAPYLDADACTRAGIRKVRDSRRLHGFRCEEKALER